MFLKTKERGEWRTIDPARLMKVKKLLDNRGKARMLLKGKAVIALFSAKLHKFMCIPQVRRSHAPALAHLADLSYPVGGARVRQPKTVLGEKSHGDEAGKE